MYADHPFEVYPETTIEKAFDGLQSANYTTCYISNDPKNARAKIYIPKSNVTQIKLLNRAEYGESYSTFHEVFTKLTDFLRDWSGEVSFETIPSQKVLKLKKLEEVFSV